MTRSSALSLGQCWLVKMPNSYRPIIYAYWILCQSTNTRQQTT